MRSRTLHFASVCAAIFSIGVLLLAFSAHVAHAETLYSQIGNGTTYDATGNTYNPGGGGVRVSTYQLFTQLNLNGSLGASGTAYYMTVQSTDAAKIATLYGLPNNGGTWSTGNAYNATNITECSIPWTYASGGPSCSGTSTGHAVNSWSINGGYITYGFTTPFTLDPTHYYEASVGYSPQYPGQTYSMGPMLGDSNGTCGTVWYDNSAGGGTNLCPGGINSLDFWISGSGGFSPTPPPSNTSITLTSPTQGTTTPSTTVPINANYHIGTDLSNFSIDGSLPSGIGINLVLQNTANGSQINLGTDFTIASSTGDHTYATSTTVAQGDYTLVATLVGIYGTFIPPPPDCVPLPPFINCTGTTQSTATLATSLPPPTFSVANGTFPILGFQVGSSTSRAGLATTTCSVVALGGCFQNALAFLFYPSPDILSQFQFLWSLIQNKPPFGYVSQTIVGLRSLNASSTPAFSFGNIPLIAEIFTPFRIGLSAILWLGFFIAWYRGRLRHLDI